MNISHRFGDLYVSGVIRAWPFLLLASVCCTGLADDADVVDPHTEVTADAASVPSAVSPHDSPAAPESDTAGRLSDNLQQLHSIQLVVDQLKAKSQEVPVELAERLELLRWMDILLTQDKSNATRLKDLREELKAAQQELENVTAVSATTTQSRSFLELDDARGMLIAEQARSQSRELQVDSVQRALALERETFESVERKRRLAQDALETASHADEKTLLSSEFALAKLRSRVHEEAVRQQQLALETARLEHKISLVHVERWTHQVELFSQRVRFSQADLQAKLAQLDVAESEMRAQLEATRSSARSVEGRLLEVTRATVAGANEQVSHEQVLRWKLARELHEERLSILNQMLAYVGVARNCWRRRYDVANETATVEEVSLWNQELDTEREQIVRYEEWLEMRSDERITELSTIRKRLLNAPESDGHVEWVEQQGELLEQAIADYGSQLVILEAGLRLMDRYDEEIDEQLTTHSTADLLAQARLFLQQGWDYEFATVEDKPITTSKVVRGALFLLVGFLLARLLSRILCRWILPRFGLNAGASLALQTITFYVMLCCGGFLALEMVNLPLTVFAFMGGAIAIGVGFGSQNVLNNFISGLILLAERPIRVGDLVDIDGVNGNIERIGARSTRLRTGSNLEMIVPNSTFLENNVTNWTLSNSLIRTSVAVGVAYGSPTRLVNELLERAVSENQRVLDDPAPIVLFKEFADNSLNFEVHFWVQMQTIMEGEQIASEVRHTIDQVLAQHEITIAFPQRDVHVDTTSPIEVNLRQISSATETLPIRREAA
ncbi:MAG TPA: hypothetical protein DCY79_04090 [Planctomycetaceae bacterium]|nr:hypothetical protein [Blastopirellula sp.]HAY78965.1 hypothetical protein [Planctomycetaceae bacterium]